MDERRISTRQLFSVMLTSRAFGLLVTREGAGNEATATQTAICAMLALTLFALMFFAYKALNHSGGICAHGGIVRSLCAAFLMLAAACSLTSFSTFVRAVSDVRNVSQAGLCALIVIVATYAAFKGVECIGRVSFISLWVIAALGVFALAANVRLAGAEQLVTAPKLLDDAFVRCFLGMIICPEAVLYIAINSRVSKKYQKKFIPLAFFATQVALYAIFALLEEGVFGVLRFHLPYPLLSLASVAEFAVFRRLDALFVSGWIILTVLRVAAFICGALELTNKSSRSRPAYIGTICAAVFACAGIMLLMGAAATNTLYKMLALIFAAIIVLVGVQSIMKNREKGHVFNEDYQSDAAECGEA
ncbi:MAG: hypothetical protein RR998_03555 [Oscillospiraceae bacterium]